MGTVTTTLMTPEEFLNFPEEPGKQELLDGELIALPPGS
jgi:Uma2 family endonuclease